MLNKIKNNLIAVIRAKNEKEGYIYSKKVIEGGIKFIELTFTIPYVDNLIEKLSKEYENDSNVFIGAGTVLDDISARIAILKGAKFIVSPHFDKNISILCNRYGIMYIPGCQTLTEIVSALESGVKLVKLFPGDLLTPKYIKNVKGPIKNVEFMPSGGVDIENIEIWLKNGAYALGIGSSLFKNVQEYGYDSIKDESKKFVDKLTSLKF